MNQNFRNFHRFSYMPQRRARGASLIEVLVSVAVTSVGLLGMAGLMAVSSRINQDAFQRTQLTFAAQALIDSMHVNPAAVADKRYDGSLGRTASVIDCRSRGCSSAERAKYDRQRFEAALSGVLPEFNGALQCGTAGVASSSAALCRLEVNWWGRAIADRGENPPQTLVWIFQP